MLSMNNTSVLLAVAIVGVVGSIAIACLLIYRTYQQAKWQQSQLQQQEQQQQSTTTGSNCRQWLHRQHPWILVGSTVLLLTTTTILLWKTSTVDQVQSVILALVIAAGVYSLAALLVTYWYCKRLQQLGSGCGGSSDYFTCGGTIACYYSSQSLEDDYDTDDSSCTPTKRVMITATTTCRVLGILCLFVTTLAMSKYAIASLLGDNPALDESSYYHGPAPILSYQGDNLNYNNVARKATLTVGYGGSWACPDYPDEWCQQSVDLFWCDVYDKTGYYASDGSLKPTWRLWEGDDLWQSSGFSCAQGMGQQQQDDDENDNGDNGDDDNSQQEYLNDPFDAPYLINVFANCDGTCQSLVVDDPFFRAKFYHVSCMKYVMMGSFLSAIVLLGLARVLLYFRTQRKAESQSLKATAGVELLPSCLDNDNDDDDEDKTLSSIRDDNNNKEGVVA
ncbi:expressed unknown protein [Seminavis robusta]|uniref:Uncharacterized protein n=1 Tax=Seminavis robusta TaxID=568900 RepID=A0A9N8HBQ9_9STRA|nr:expressed unknown protein [Seminavis robusta]|eukprot:Sro269_g104050.1 n/a (448) ;mRNA; f:52358-53701